MMAHSSFCQIVTFQFLSGVALITVVTTPHQAVCHCVLVPVREELLIESVLKFTHRGHGRQLLGSSHLRYDHGADRVLFLQPHVTKSSHSS